MSLPLAFHPDVQPEMDEAYRWYENKREGLGDDFLAAVEEAFERILRMPEIHQVAIDNVRRVLSRRFPYAVF